MEFKYAVFEIRPGKKSIPFFFTNSLEEAKEECSRCNRVGDFTYQVLELEKL